MENEIRSLKGELRAAPDFTLQGTAARFNTRSSDLGGFVETIAPGAFTRSLKAGGKVIVAVNHDPNQVLGSTKSGTAKVWADDSGLRFSVKLDPSNSIHSNAYASVKRGDMDSCSFAFKVPKGGDTFAPDTDANGIPTILRTLTDVDLLDASIVTYPAYPTGTSCDARALEERGLLRVAVRKVDITPEILARSQGMTVTQMNARSDEARRSVIKNQGARIDADLHARAARLGKQIAADAQRDAFQERADEELRERMEIAAGRTCRTRRSR